MIEVGIIGATGYVGVELVRILLKHPQVKKIHLSSVSFEGQNIEDIYCNLRNLCAGSKCSGVLLSSEEVLEKSDIIFTALPHGIAETHADFCVKNGKKLIDLSADFRFDTDEATFKKWYKKSWDFPAVHEESVYGLPELNRNKIKAARIIGNPGCYVTSATLGLMPALATSLIEVDPIIVDSKSGVTGTGRNPTTTNNFSECGESFMPYGVGAHRHQPEIANNLSHIAGKKCGVIFTPHLLPMNRGIISTMYTHLKKETSVEEIHSLYEDFYKNEPFVRVLPLGSVPVTRNVRYSNYCDISVHVVHDGKILQIVSALDNMMKGAASQAVQNMNIMYGFAETDGIDFVPAAF
ncbi:MAG: N-acetyl-gamma-glutamyl-phosphate reductase [Spirochaetaceae bacterium]|nr:N-acetyl-gamma-glutamyl-phosphate reductase [Spirochaetaceae bacterium]